jgi:hypothetical protein
VSKGHFLIGDGIGDYIFWHESSRFSACWRLGEVWVRGTKD